MKPCRVERGDGKKARRAETASMEGRMVRFGVGQQLALERRGKEVRTRHVSVVDCRTRTGSERRGK
jgi:hypothetical protein